MVEHLKKIRRLYETRFSFGATAAIITNLGLITGLRTGVHAKLSIISGMLIVAFADNISDSLGIHIYQESECLDIKEVWFSTTTNFITRVIVSLTFISLVFFLPINAAVICSLVWGMLLLAIMSYMIAKSRKINPYLAVFEHVAIASIVIIITDFVGKLVISKIKF